MARRPHVPSYRLHKPSGQAVVTLSGVDHYLGKYDSPESREKYNRLVAEWLARNRANPPLTTAGLVVSEVLLPYWKYARSYYGTPEGRGTSQTDRIYRALHVVLELYGSTVAREFGPLALKVVREKMVEQGWCRRVVNQRVGCVVAAFKWAVGEQLLPPEVWQALAAVPALREGRTTARESVPVQPVEPAHVAAIRALVLPVVWDMVQVQSLSAMRPGEVVRLRGTDLDRSREVWLYTPLWHKTRHHGHRRVILLGPQAQVILAPYLARYQNQPAAYLFSPRDAIAERWAQLGRTLNLKARKAPGTHYLVTSYWRAIHKACLKAGIPPWHPHQLRHGAATRLAAEFGIETARIILGHTSLDTTQIYAERDLQRALDVMRQRG